MSEILNMYCDESYYSAKTGNFGNSILAAGGIWCPQRAVRRINNDIREIKKKHQIISAEMKWGKISEAKKQAYFDLINYFFDQKELRFVAVIADNRYAVSQEQVYQFHDDRYYKTVADMIKAILHPGDRYNIYLDIKDTKSKTKIRKLQEIISESGVDLSTVSKMQGIRSHEVEIMQIPDILTGAMGYASRNLSGVRAKNESIDLIEKRSGCSLTENPLSSGEKFAVIHLRLEEGQRAV